MNRRPTSPYWVGLLWAACWCCRPGPGRLPSHTWPCRRPAACRPTSTPAPVSWPPRPCLRAGSWFGRRPGSAKPSCNQWIPPIIFSVFCWEGFLLSFKLRQPKKMDAHAFFFPWVLHWAEEVLAGVVFPFFVVMFVIWWPVALPLWAVAFLLPGGCGCQNSNGIPFYLVGEFTHFRTGYGSKLNHQPGFSPCFHLPGEPVLGLPYF